MSKAQHYGYQRVLWEQRQASDPYGTLANAVVEVTAADYRKAMARLIAHGLTMGDYERSRIESRVTECRLFFESQWGDLLAHGLADVIWDKLQAEFAEQYALFKVKLPYMRKRREKLQRRAAAVRRRKRRNKERRRARRARLAAEKAASREVLK